MLTRQAQSLATPSAFFTVVLGMISTMEWMLAPGGTACSHGLRAPIMTRPSACVLVQRAVSPSVLSWRTPPPQSPRSMYTTSVMVVSTLSSVPELMRRHKRISSPLP